DLGALPQCQITQESAGLLRGNGNRLTFIRDRQWPHKTKAQAPRIVSEPQLLILRCVVVGHDVPLTTVAYSPFIFEGDKARYDINPLGPMMHLKELARQATPRLRPLRRQNGFSLIAVKSSMIAFLRHLHAPRFPWRTLREVSSQSRTT